MILPLITIVFCCTLSLPFSRVNADSCEIYNHPQYGIGKCIDEKQCPNSLYLSGLCESKPSNIKCCFSLNDTDNEEFRAVWIATVANMNWPSSNTATPAQQQAELIQILDTVQLLNMNVVILQVITTHRCLFFITNKDVLKSIGSSSW
jgi:uncharacterized lipoprotein YddW (UPF0748 family)